MDIYLEKDLFKKMKAKLGKLRNYKRSLQKEEDIVTSPLPSTKSLGDNVKYITPKKLLFFRDEETKL